MKAFLFVIFMVLVLGTILYFANDDFQSSVNGLFNKSNAQKIEDSISNAVDAVEDKAEEIAD